MKINDMFDLQNYEQFFKKEQVEETRWDKIDDKAIQHLFAHEYLKRLLESFLSYFADYSEDDERYRKLGRFLYPAGNFEVLLSFLRLTIDQKDFQTRISHLTQMLEQDNCYNDPSWILWKHFLSDVFDALTQWERYDGEKLECIIRKF